MLLILQILIPVRLSTQDLGKKYANNFEVLGRFDNSDIRGCNLMFYNIFLFFVIN
jgi:hypothetical protein